MKWPVVSGGKERERELKDEAKALSRNRWHQNSTLNAFSSLNSSLLSHSFSNSFQYRPTRLDKLVFHSDIGEALQKLVRRRSGIKKRS